MISFELNGQTVQVDATPDTPLLWTIRDHLNLKGSKFGCGMGLCGACSMPCTSQNSCSMPCSTTCLLRST